MDELTRLWKTACEYAKRRGAGDESEDFASDLVQRKLEGKSKHQTVEQAFIDYSRSLRTSKRVLGSPSGYFSAGVTTSFDRPIGDSDDDGSSLHNLIGVPGDDMELRGDAGVYSEFVAGIIGCVSDTAARASIWRIYLEWLGERM